MRSQNKADLQAIISNKDISDEEKQNAINTMVSMTDLTEKEAAAELLLEAKGFENVIVNLTGETADVVVPDADLDGCKTCTDRGYCKEENRCGSREHCDHASESK